jgi:transposase
MIALEPVDLAIFAQPRFTDPWGPAVKVLNADDSNSVGIPSCLVGLEACATAHHWAPELISLGHEARLMPPNYVKAYVKRNKHDVADAEAICEAVRRPSMRFVPVKTVEQQSALMMPRARDLLVRQPTMLVNALRGHDNTVSVTFAVSTFAHGN